MRKKQNKMKLVLLSALSVLSLQIASPAWAKNCKILKKEFQGISKEIKIEDDNSLHKLNQLISNLEGKESDDPICKEMLEDAKKLSNELSASTPDDSSPSPSRSPELTPHKSSKSEFDSNVNQQNSNWLGWLNLALILLTAGAGAVYAVRFNNISKKLERKINNLEIKNSELFNSINKHPSALDNLLDKRQSSQPSSTNNLNTNISKSSPDFKQKNTNVNDFIFSEGKANPNLESKAYSSDNEREISQLLKQEDSLLCYYNSILSADESNVDRQHQIEQNWSTNARMSVRNLEDFLEGRGAELELEESSEGCFYAITKGSYTAVLPIPGKSIKTDSMKEVFDMQGDGSSLKKVAREAQFILNNNEVLTLTKKGLIITN